MYNCSSYNKSAPFMTPNSMKDDEDIMNRLNQEMVEKAKEPNVPFKIVKISKNKLSRILKKEPGTKIQHKSSLQGENSSNSEKEENLVLKKEWNELPQQVQAEVLKLTTQKQSRKCVKNCPCKYTHGLIQLYHNAQLLREKADRIEICKNHHKSQISHSVADFSQEDNSTCNTLIQEMKSQNCKMEELKTIYKNVKEKLKLHSEENSRNQKCLKELSEKMQEGDEITKKFEVQEKIFHLEEEQQIIESAFMNRAISLEEEDISKAKDEIQMRLKRKEEWKEQERSFDQRRCKERQTDTLLVLKSTNLMENYVAELKAEINL